MDLFDIFGVATTAIIGVMAVAASLALLGGGDAAQVSALVDEADAEATARPGHDQRR